MKKIFLPAMMALLLFTAGCQQPPNGETPAPSTDKTSAVTDGVKVEPITPPPIKPIPPKDEETPAPSEADTRTMRVKVYYPDDSGVHLVEVERKIVVEHDGEKYIAALEMLLDEPYEENLTKIFPKNANILSVTVSDGLATVNLDGSILKNMVGGSTGEEFLVGSVVDTLTNFPEIQRVKFLVDGREVETLSGHMDLSSPLERMTSLIE